MIPSPGCPLWLPDLPGPAGASAMPAVSYTTPWGTIAGFGIIPGERALSEVCPASAAGRQLALEHRAFNRTQPHFRRPREGGDPVFNERWDYWIPTFVTMTPKGMRPIPALCPML
jgi:hypothetical protein